MQELEKILTQLADKLSPAEYDRMWEDLVRALVACLSAYDAGRGSCIPHVAYLHDRETVLCVIRRETSYVFLDIARQLIYLSPDFVPSSIHLKLAAPLT